MKQGWRRSAWGAVLALCVCVGGAQAVRPIASTVDTSDKDTVTVSNKNALLLADTGAPTPSVEPSGIARFFLPLVVNREYLPSEQYYLRNITMRPVIPTTAKELEGWPFQIDSISYVRHLEDMTYNSRADIIYELPVANTAKKGVYPITFSVSATVWRLDAVNGTNITEDVELTVTTYVNVLSDGTDSGVTSTLGALDVAAIDENGQTIATPKGNAGDRITFRLPLVNRGKNLTNVTITPVASSNLDEFPFVSEAVNYGKTLPDMVSGETVMAEYSFQISPQATLGNKSIRFKATYKENGVEGTCELVSYIYIVEGYEAPDKRSAPPLTVAGYTMTVGGEPVEQIYAGDDAVLTLTLRNDGGDAAYKVRAALSIDTAVLVFSPGETDTRVLKSIGAGKTATAQYALSARGDASSGPTNVSVGIHYENWEITQASATQTLTLPVKQPVRVQIGEAKVYDSNVQPNEPMGMGLTITNLGRSKIYNVSIDVAGAGLKMSEPFYGGDVLSAAQMEADFYIQSERGGAAEGTVVVSYEDGDGEQYQESVPLRLVFQEATPLEATVQSAPINQPKTGPNAAMVGGTLVALTAAGGGTGFFFWKRKHP